MSAISLANSEPQKSSRFLVFAICVIPWSLLGAGLALAGARLAGMTVDGTGWRFAALASGAAVGAPLVGILTTCLCARIARMRSFRFALLAATLNVGVACFAVGVGFSLMYPGV